MASVAITTGAGLQPVRDLVNAVKPGMGAALMTNRSRTGGDAEARSRDRWTLVRRGLALYAFGYVLDWIWEGTILFYYGAFFLAAAVLFGLSTRWLVTTGVHSPAQGWNGGGSNTSSPGTARSGCSVARPAHRVASSPTPS